MQNRSQRKSSSPAEQEFPGGGDGQGWTWVSRTVGNVKWTWCSWLSLAGRVTWAVTGFGIKEKLADSNATSLGNNRRQCFCMDGGHVHSLTAAVTVAGPGTFTKTDVWQRTQKPVGNERTCVSTRPFCRLLPGGDSG